MKRILEVEDEYDFSLLGICCHVKDYRLSWEINKNLGIELEKTHDIHPIYDDESAAFSASIFEDEENQLTFILISNKQNGKILIPEQPQIDFFLKISGSQHELGIPLYKQTIMNIDLVLTVMELQPKMLKSKPNLVF